MESEGSDVWRVKDLVYGVRAVMYGECMRGVMYGE